VAFQTGSPLQAAEAPKRLNRLDVLRAVAILLILGRHVYCAELWMRIGWMGVDLFFVLSGFLVTGLLLSEQRRYGQMEPVRFWLRRAFKIYPPFYVLLAVSAVVGLHQSGAPMADLLFVQNFRQGWWHHTWSLAIEEHFYLLMPLALVWMVRTRGGDPDPFTRLPRLVAVVCAIGLGLRLATLPFGPRAGAPLYLFRHAYPTPMRIDGLAFGAWIAYRYHYGRLPVAGWTRAALACVVAACALILLPCTLSDPDRSAALMTVGFTATYLGFGGLLMVVLAWPASTGATWAGGPARALGYLGRHSYSIYLWHLPIKLAIERAFARWAPGHRDQSMFVVYAVASVAGGIIASKIVEAPILRLRDRLLPAPRRESERPSPAPAEALRPAGSLG
jgi:peptidoglycan/LPS O-acetylase OafA/YrhL